MLLKRKCSTILIPVEGRLLCKDCNADACQIRFSWTISYDTDSSESTSILSIDKEDFTVFHAQITESKILVFGRLKKTLTLKQTLYNQYKKTHANKCWLAWNNSGSFHNF